MQPVARSVDRSSENDASSSATRKSLFLTSKSEMLARKPLFLIGKVKPNKNHSRLFIVSSKSGHYHRYRSEFPEARIIILTTYTGDVQVLRAMKVGARA